jgi:hypothetical protein
MDAAPDTRIQGHRRVQAGRKREATVKAQLKLIVALLMVIRDLLLTLTTLQREQNELLRGLDDSGDEWKNGGKRV